MKLAGGLADIELARIRAHNAVPYFVGWHIHIAHLAEQMQNEIAAAHNNGHRDGLIRKWTNTFDGMARLGLEQRRAIARQALNHG